MSTKGIAALAAFCFIVIAALPLAVPADADGEGPSQSDVYGSQLDANGRAVYDATASAIAAALEAPVNTLQVTVSLPEPVLCADTPAAEAYARGVAEEALAALYYTDPMAVWLWDLPVAAPAVDVSTGSVELVASGAELGQTVYFTPVSVTFSLSVPSDMADDPETEADELSERIKAVEDAASGVTVSGSVSEKVKAIADRLVGVRDSDDAEGQVGNVYDALVANSSSSAGIAMAFAHLCQLNGVEAVVVAGTVHSSFGEDAHHGYWGLVRDGDSWFGADLTWYDGDDRSVLMAGYATQTSAVAAGERFGVTHIADMGPLDAPAMAEDGFAWPDDSTFLEKYGTHVFAVVIVVVIVGTLLYAVRKGNI